jgi:hypothetical protein
MHGIASRPEILEPLGLSGQETIKINLMLYNTQEVR